MVKKSHTFSFLLSGIAMLILILDSKTALAGTAKGLELCIRTVIPSLFPFFVISVLFTDALLTNPIAWLRPLGSICGIPAGAEGIFLLGLVSGYPVGAQAVTQAWEAGCLSDRDAKRLLGFCSNCGPSFLFGITSVLFSSPWIPWILWGIHIASAVLNGVLLPGKSKSRIEIPALRSSLNLSNALQKGTRNMASVCGWIMLARCVLSYLEKWCLFQVPNYIRVGIYGLWELANGCICLAEVSSEYVRFLAASGFLAFGGICVGLQTISVTGKLGTGWYFPGKILQVSLSILLADILASFLYPQAQFHPVFLLLPAVVTATIRIKRKKEVAISEKLLYNGEKKIA